MKGVCNLMFSWKRITCIEISFANSVCPSSIFVEYIKLYLEPASNFNKCMTLHMKWEKKKKK